MNFDFSPDQKALRDQARKFLSEQASSTRVRRILDTETPYDAELWRGMAEMGWTGTAIPESYGGAGFGYLELCVLAEELGRSVAPAPFSSTIYLAAEALLLAGSEAQKRRWLPAIAAGEAIGCLALAEGPQAPTPESLTTRALNGLLNGTKAPVIDGDVADVAVVVARDGRAVSLFLVDLRGAGVSRTPLETVDPTRSVASITFANTPAEPLGEPGAGWPLLERVLDRAAVLVAFEQVGGGAGRARHGARVRRRALRVRPADRLVPGDQAQARRHVRRDRAGAIERVLRRRGRCRPTRRELPVAAAAARVSASEAYFHAAKENIQTHGGMGFTWEFDCHLYYRPAKLLAAHARERPALEGSAHQPRSKRVPTPRRRTHKGGSPWTSTIRAEEAAFRAEARAFLADNAEPKSGTFETWQSRFGDAGLQHAKDFQRKKAEAGFAALAWPEGLGRPRADADLPGDLRPGGDALPRAARLLRDRPRDVHADPVHVRHRGGQAPLRPAGPARRRGLVSALLRARRPDRTWPGCAPAQCGTAMTGSSTARRSGRRARTRRTWASW